MKELKTVYNDNCHVGFMMRRKNKIVKLQWEPFSGQIGANGVTFLSVNQSICNLPPYAMVFPIMLIYNGVDRDGFVEIDPHIGDQIRIFLDKRGSNGPCTMGDTIVVPGQSIDWITA